MKLGVIGLGVMGKHHVRICHALGVLAAVSDFDEKVASKVGTEFVVPWFQEPGDEFFAGLDGVIIATPTAVHEQSALLALKHGCHIFVEKPLSLSLKSAEAICQAASDAGKILAVGYIERYNPAYKALKHLVTANAFQDITSVNIRRVGGTPRSADNVIIDLMTHDFSLLLDLFGAPPSKTYTHSHFNNNTLDSAQVMLEFGNASATCEANWVSPIKIRTIHLTGVGGYCEVDLIKQQLQIVGSSFNEQPDRPKIFDKIGLTQTSTVLSFQQEPLRAEIQSFIEAISTQSDVGIVSGQEAVKILSMTLKASEQGGI